MSEAIGAGASPWTHLVATSDYYSDSLRDIETVWGLPRLVQALRYLDYLEAKRKRERKEARERHESTDTTPAGA